MISTLFPFTPTIVDDVSRRQGRSKKKLRPVVEHEGRVWVAYHEGRGNRFFGATKQEANNNLQAGSQSEPPLNKRKHGGRAYA